MKTYYSIIKIVTNSLVDDAISVGLVLGDDDKIFIRISERKLKIAKHLTNVNSKNLDYFFSKIDEQLQQQGDNFNLFSATNVINSNYFLYLSKYNNNLIQYTEPNFINIKKDKFVFDKLFTLYVDEDFKNVTKPKEADSFSKVLEIVDKELISKVSNKIHTNIKFTDKILPVLYFSYEIDCIGLNGAFTGAKSINFNHSDKTIKKELSNYYALTGILENTHKRYGKDNNFYVIAEEPENISSKAHKIWEQVGKLEKFKLIHPEESAIVVDKVEETSATMFIDR
jgi:hypothetical protein